MRTGKSTTLLVANGDNPEIDIRNADTLQLSEDGRFVLAEYVQQVLFRHSRRSVYRLFEVADTKASKNAVYINKDGRSDAAVDYAHFGPKGSQIVLVQDHDIYYIPSANDPGRVQRITNTGSASVFNGICDWVYEEEIFSRTDALWFSANGQRLAFAQFDDGAVHNVTMWQWGRSPDSTLKTQYPDGQRVTYPKVGTQNPHVSLFAVELKEAAADVKPVSLPVPKRVLETSTEEPILVAVKWTDDSNVLAAWKNRQQTHAYVVLCHVPSNSAGVANECPQIADLQSSTGWVDLSEPLYINSPPQQQRLALVKVRNNLQRIVTYTIAAGMGIERVLNTSVVNVERIVHWNSVNGTIFFLGNNRSVPHEQHLYIVADDEASSSVTLAGPQCLTCELRQSAKYTHFSARFAPATQTTDPQHLILVSQGPAVPRHDVYTWTRRPNDGRHSLQLTHERQSNAELVAKLYNDGLAELQVRYLPPIRLSAQPSDDGDAYDAYVRLLLPANFDETKRDHYALLVHVYGGPDTFAGTSEWRLGYSEFLASNRSVVVAQIDGRGTKRRDVRHLQAVYGRLGQTEVLDQIDVAR